MARPIPGIEVSALTLGQSIFATDRGDMVVVPGRVGMGGFGEYYVEADQMEGVKDWLKKGAGAIKSGAKAVGKGAVATSKFVGKAAVNAALNKVGLGPIFTDNKGQQLVVDDKGNASIQSASLLGNPKVLLIGGGLALVLFLALRKK